MAISAIEDGIRFFNMKRYDIALDHFRSVKTDGLSDKSRMELAYYQGLCYTKLEKYDEALLLLEQVVTSDMLPVRTMQCRLTLAYVYMITRRAKMAEFELNRLLKNGVESVQIYTMLAYVAWAQRNNEKAIELYEKAIAFDSTNLTAINGLGYVLVDSGVDVKRGLELCRKAVQTKPQNAAYLDSLGWAYYKSGDLNEARTALRRALEIAPRHYEITKHMRAVIGEAS
ncbi:MAG: tetratricopeptide repeat protein [Spirochaetaceae bacterium]|jgi:tetratricopeptide (TPR) repeat protein|nr:tetratricopeptide repeat protein [Spirochaetaceae bacterium]